MDADKNKLNQIKTWNHEGHGEHEEMRQKCWKKNSAVASDFFSSHFCDFAASVRAIQVKKLMCNLHLRASAFICGKFVFGGAANG